MHVPPATLEDLKLTLLHTKEDYFAAVRAGLEQNYEPMKQMFDVVIKETLWQNE